MPQQRITVSKVYLWNGGTDTITSSDLTSIDPLRIEIGREAELLDARIVYQTDKANQLALDKPTQSNSEQETTLSIRFDYLDPADGGAIQLVHTGPRFHPIQINGKVKGTHFVERIISPPYRRFPGPLRELAASRLFAWFGVFFYFVGGTAAIVGFLRNYSRWYLLPLGAFGLFGSWVMFMGYARRPLPEKFKNIVE